MGSESKITSKGQTTIPVDIREHLGLKDGDIVRYIETEQGVLLVPKTQPVESMFGMLAKYGIPGTTVEDYDEAIGEAVLKRNKRI